MQMLLEVFPVWIKSNAILTSMRTMDMCPYALREQFEDYHKQESLQKNFPENGSRPMGIMNASTLLACGSTNGNPFHSPLSWMTLA
jgi:hypothetical protein